MPTLNPTHRAVPAVVPAGELRVLTVDQIKPSTNNPRLLFDPPQLMELKKNIAEHGVLVPITVFQPKGQRQFSILDGERRYRCVVELTNEIRCNMARIRSIFSGWANRGHSDDLAFACFRTLS